MLEVKNLSVFYGRIQAIFDFSFHVERGEVVALIGANGAGKSTLINTISGLISAKSGSISFGGETINRMPPEGVVQKGLIQVAEGGGVVCRADCSGKFKDGGLHGPGKA